MSIRRLLWVLFTALILFGPASFRNGYSQVEQSGRITFKVASKEPLPQLETSAHRIVIKTDKETSMGALINKKGQRVLSFPDRADIIMPHNLPVLIAKDRSVILQFGDEQDLSHPSLTNLYWLTSEGKEFARLKEYYRADALVSLSEDGFVAAVGSRMDGPQGKFLSLFNHQGNRLWEVQLGEGRNVHAEPVVTPQGSRIALITTDSKDPLKDHRILILDKKGGEEKTVTMGIIQKIVAVGSGKALFVQGSKRHGLINLSSNNLIWSNEGNLRLIAPHAAALSPDGNVLFLLLAEWQGRPQAKYRWRLKALDAANGSEIGIFNLPDEMPSTGADVFGTITEDTVSILFGPEHYVISWSR